MTDLEAVRADLLADLQETLEFEGHVPMHEFAWTLRGYKLGLNAAEIDAVSHDAYAELTSRRSLKLMWNRWPKALEDPWPAEPGTPLVFDLAPERPVSDPYLLLVPAAGPV